MAKTDGNGSEKLDPASLSDAKLADEQHRISDAREALRADGLAVQAELDRRVAAKRIAALNDAERASLTQALQVEGIASAEGVGTPGG